MPIPKKEAIRIKPLSPDVCLKITPTVRDSEDSSISTKTKTSIPLTNISEGREALSNVEGAETDDVVRVAFNEALYPEILRGYDCDPDIEDRIAKCPETANPYQWFKEWLIRREPYQKEAINKLSDDTITNFLLSYHQSAVSERSMSINNVLTPIQGMAIQNAKDRKMWVLQHQSSSPTLTSKKITVDGDKITMSFTQTIPEEFRLMDISGQSDDQSETLYPITYTNNFHLEVTSTSATNLSSIDPLLPRHMDNMIDQLGLPRSKIDLTYLDKEWQAIYQLEKTQRHLVFDLVETGRIPLETIQMALKKNELTELKKCIQLGISQSVILKAIQNDELPSLAAVCDSSVHAIVISQAVQNNQLNDLHACVDQFDPNTIEQHINNGTLKELSEKAKAFKKIKKEANISTGAIISLAVVGAAALIVLNLATLGALTPLTIILTSLIAVVGIGAAVGIQIHKKNTTDYHLSVTEFTDCHTSVDEFSDCHTSVDEFSDCQPEEAESLSPTLRDSDHHELISSQTQDPKYDDGLDEKDKYPPHSM